MKINWGYLWLPLPATPCLSYLFGRDIFDLNVFFSILLAPPSIWSLVLWWGLMNYAGGSSRDLMILNILRGMQIFWFLVGLLWVYLYWNIKKVQDWSWLTVPFFAVFVAFSPVGLIIHPAMAVFPVLAGAGAAVLGWFYPIWTFILTTSMLCGEWATATALLGFYQWHGRPKVNIGLLLKAMPLMLGVGTVMLLLSLIVQIAVKQLHEEPFPLKYGSCAKDDKEDDKDLLNE